MRKPKKTVSQKNPQTESKTPISNKDPIPYFEARS